MKAAICNQRQTSHLTLKIKKSLKSSRLRYVNDADAGLVRLRVGKGFCYLDADGNPVRELKR